MKSKERKLPAVQKKLFPLGFLWGAAASSYQTEGNNFNTDWYEWEQKGKTKDKAGLACDYWHRWKGDHELLSELGVNSFRLSLEWARIEPEEGKFSEEAIGHYREILQDLKNRNIKTVVTLWHYTMPLWFADKYGWHDTKAIRIFTNYCKKITEELGNEIDIFVTMNEPRLVLNRGYIVGNRPPGKRNPLAFWRARRNMVRAHQECYDLIKNIFPNSSIGIAQFCNDLDFYGFRLPSLIVEKIEDFYNWHFFKEIGDKQDYIGINYYFALKIGFRYPFVTMQQEREKKTEMGWGIFSQGLYEIISDAHRIFQKPIYVLENGIANAKDDMRTDFIKDHLTALQQSISEGADVRGYFYWSLTDNFEWEDGFDRKFGLVETDYSTLARKPRKSFYDYQKIIKNNSLE